MSSSGDGSYFDPQDMRNMGGLWNRMRTTAVVYIIGALALAGIPPLAGFWSKDEILLEASHLNQVAYILLLIAAGFTAFYMTRQVLMVFFGQPKSEAAAHAAESPRVMTIPLMILAFLAVTVGWINIGGAFTAWLAPEEHFAGLDFGVAGLSVGLALLAIIAGYVVYRPRPQVVGAKDDPLRSLGFIFNTLAAKYKIDELYGVLIVRPFTWLSGFLANVIDWRFWHDFVHDSIIANAFKGWTAFLSGPIDRGVIDGIGDGTGKVVGWGARRLRRVQTGYVRNYALVVLLGVVAVIAWFTWRILGQ